MLIELRGSLRNAPTCLMCWREQMRGLWCYLQARELCEEARILRQVLAKLLLGVDIAR